MTNLISDTITLLKIKLPQGISKKRVLLNFAILYALSIPEKITKGFNRKVDLPSPSVRIESDVWQSFNHVISMYVRYLAPAYILRAHIICSAMTGWHFKGFIDFLKENFTAKDVATIPDSIVTNVNSVARSIVDEFAGLDYETVNRWLMTYQYGIFNLVDNKKELQEKLKGHLIIELGGGIGANAAVNATISEKGVWIYDVPPVLEVQKIVTSRIRKHVKMSDISFYQDPQELMAQAANQPYVVFSHWAFTEFPLSLRKALEPLINGAEFAYFTCNSKFEGVENLAYFEELNSRQQGKTLLSRPVTWVPLKNHNCVMLESNKAEGAVSEKAYG